MSIREQLGAARQELLDLGLRNPLLNYRTYKARGLDIVDEVPTELHRILVDEGRSMSFLPVPESEIPDAEDDAFENDEYLGDVADLFAQPDEEESGTASRHTDSRLQTPYTSAKLQSRLLSTFYAARTFIEEQGVNVLYLALGMLEWYDSESSDKKRRAPLLLVPVELGRTDVKARFRLACTGEDVGGNLTLQTKLKGSFGIKIPLPDPEEDLDVEAYFAAVAEAVDDQPRWRVDPEAVHLGFFQFGKLLMYLDLDVEEWPESASPLNHEVVNALLVDGFEPAEGRVGDAEHLDRHLHPDDVHQVVDADGSQTLALLDVKNGNHLVIQGPPGTGKSQTITNLIAEAVGQGKTVLFVAEKMAALEVVKRRLDGVHLGDACLELHSHKTNKKELLAELQHTLNLGKPQSDALEMDLDVLVDSRDRLNEYAEAVNAPIGESGVRPHRAFGVLLKQSERWTDVQPPRVEDDALAEWTRADYERRASAVAEMQTLVGKTGIPIRHPFWGSRRKVFLPTEQAPVEQAARAAADEVNQLASITEDLASFLGLAADKPADTVVLCRAARRALTAPDLRGVRVDAAEWRARRSDIEVLLSVGQRFSAIRSRYDEALIPEAWEQDVLETRQHLAAHGEKWYRLFVGDWRRAKGRLAGLMSGPLPKTNEERVALADAVLESQRLRKELDSYASLGAGLYGLQWQGEASDWEVLKRIAEWMGGLYGDVEAGTVPRGLVAFLAGGPDLDALEPLVARAEKALRTCKVALDEASKLVQFDPKRRYGKDETLGHQPFDEIERVVRGWAENVHRLQEMVALNHRAEAMANDGLSAFVRLAAAWPHASSHLSDALTYARYTKLLDRAFAERPALAQFDGSLHGDVLERFKERDRLALAYNRARLALDHWKQVDRVNRRGSAAGQLGVLYHEFGKKTRHKPIRWLMTNAGRAIQAIKPVFMMSPMSVAAYLPPGTVEFDLVVFDEASQVKPVDAFGALLRGQQAVVVGDSKQLPPTSFFDSVVGEVDEEEASGAADIESILELFKSKRAPERMLRWHYRSRHESLIAVSNKEFYDNKLVTFPSPDAERAETGLAYHYLPETSYDRGGRRANRGEAKAIAEAVMEHARSTPDLTLLVATFSTAQQKEVWDQIEIQRRQDPSAESFFSDDKLEPFTVKNLENVQGDERDVVFISVGYGRDQNGTVSMNFGPLNREGGERRLNVLISRARRRCEVFTNLRAEDIDLNRTSARGVAAFKRYLQFAQTGELEINVPTGAEADSPFEEAVADALRDLGHRVEHQIGVGGFRIDLAVVDPRRPGRYLLGIECDGASYHSARTARDRDRIRQSVLEGLGWRIHRIWSTDWFRDPQRELKRAAEAIERAKVEPLPERPAPVAPSTLERVEEDPAEAPSAPVLSEPYEKALRMGHNAPLHEVPTRLLAEDVRAVVEVESPVHLEEVARRIMEVSGVSRLGSRIRKAIERATSLAARDGSVVRRGDFLYRSGQQSAEVPVRDRSALPNGSRSFDYIAPEEIEAAIGHVVEASFGIATEDLPLEVCRLFGFGQTSAAMRDAVERVLVGMMRSGALTERGGMIHPGADLAAV